MTANAEEAAQVIRLASIGSGIPARFILSKSRAPRHVEIRWRVWLSLHRKGWSDGMIAEAFSCRISTVKKALQKLKKLTKNQP